MLKIAHIIHPVIVPPTSDLVIAQPITFETMKIANKYKKPTIDLSLYGIQYYDEARIPLPDCFDRVPDLKRSVADIKTFKKRRKLALIKDILNILNDSDKDADFFIYTNVDIALQPYFYDTISEIINQGYDAFVVNRRTISDQYTTIYDIPLMYSEIGTPHKGYDCFVFSRKIYSKFKLGNICIGTAWIGRVLLANMITYGKKFKEFRDEHLTFHIGDSFPWRNDEYQDYFVENRNEYLEIFSQLEAESGGYDSIICSYLLEAGKKRQYPSFS